MQRPFLISAFSLILMERLVRIGQIAINGGNDMVNKQLKCKKCGKVLLRVYSRAIVSVTCTCGCTTDMKHTKDEDYVYSNPTKGAK